MGMPYVFTEEHSLCGIFFPVKQIVWPEPVMFMGQPAYRLDALGLPGGFLLHSSGLLRLATEDEAVAQWMSEVQTVNRTGIPGFSEAFEYRATPRPDVKISISFSMSHTTLKRYQPDPRDTRGMFWRQLEKLERALRRWYCDGCRCPTKPSVT